MNTANPYGSAPTHHMLSVLVQNKPGVLARVASLFARRGYNIFSLAVAPTDDPEFSRISIVVDVESAPLEQIVKQLFKLIEVVRISELDPRKSVERELMVATIRATPEQRGQVVELANIFEGKILSVGQDAITCPWTAVQKSWTIFQICCDNMESSNRNEPAAWRFQSSTAPRRNNPF